MYGHIAVVNQKLIGLADIELRWLSLHYVMKLSIGYLSFC